VPGARCQGRNSGSGNRRRGGYEKLPGSAFPSLPGLTKDARCLVCCLLSTAFCLLPAFFPDDGRQSARLQDGKGSRGEIAHPWAPAALRPGAAARGQDLGFRINTAHWARFFDGLARSALDCGSSSYRLSSSAPWPLPHEPKAEGGSCCYRSPRQASPAIRFANP